MAVVPTTDPGKVAPSDWTTALKSTRKRGPVAAPLNVLPVMKIVAEYRASTNPNGKFGVPVSVTVRDSTRCIARLFVARHQ